MSILDDFHITPSQSSDNSETSASDKLAQQAIESAAITAAGIAATTLLFRSRHIPVPAMFKYETAEAATELNAGRLAAQSVRQDSAAMASIASEMKNGDALAANARVGSLPGPQFGNGTRELAMQHAGFVANNKWIVDGVNVGDQGVDLYLTKTGGHYDGHWIKLSGFAKPDAETNALQMLHTDIRQLRTDRNGLTSVVLGLGRRPEIELSGPVKAVEWWHH